MKTSPSKVILAALFVASAFAVNACGKDKGRGIAGAAAADAVPLPVPLDAKSVLVISDKLLAATTIEAKASGSVQDPQLKAFEAGLYLKLKANCAAGCHAVNAFPFASDGVSLAWSVAKRYIAANPDESKMIQNVKAGHNGVNPALASELSALIQKVATAQ